MQPKTKLITLVMLLLVLSGTYLIITNGVSLAWFIICSFLYIMISAVLIQALLPPWPTTKSPAPEKTKPVWFLLYKMPMGSHTVVFPGIVEHSTGDVMYLMRTKDCPSDVVGAVNAQSGKQVIFSEVWRKMKPED